MCCPSTQAPPFFAIRGEAVGCPRCRGVHRTQRMVPVLMHWRAHSSCMKTAADHELTFKVREDELKVIAEATKISINIHWCSPTVLCAAAAQGWNEDADTK